MLSLNNLQFPLKLKYFANETLAGIDGDGCREAESIKMMYNACIQRSLAINVIRLDRKWVGGKSQDRAFFVKNKPDVRQ